MFKKYKLIKLAGLTAELNERRKHPIQYSFEVDKLAEISKEIGQLEFELGLNTKSSTIIV